MRARNPLKNRSGPPALLLAAAGAAMLAIFAATPADAAPRPAQPRGPACEAGFLLNFTDFDDEALLDEAIGFSPRFGVLLDPHNEIEFLFGHVETEDILDPTIDVDIDHVQVCYVFNFSPGGVVPYVTGGLGWIDSDATWVGSESTGVFSFGGGVKVFLGKTAHLRFEGRWNLFEGEGIVFRWQEGVAMFELGFGLGWRF
jgi:hypothetical protein